MDIETIRERVKAGNYLAKGHAVQHALKEGFERMTWLKLFSMEGSSKNIRMINECSSVAVQLLSKMLPSIRKRKRK